MDKLRVIARSPLFEMLSDPELDYVAELSRPRHLNSGEVMFEEGDLGDSVFVIVAGEIEVLRRDATGAQKVLTVLNPMEFFGEMSLVDKEYRSATIRARTDVDLLQLSAENLTTFRKNYRDGFTFVIINIARVLSTRLRDANSRLAARL